jgi:hypothetical protein
MTCWSLIHVEVCVYLMFNCSSIRISFDLESPRTKKYCTPLIICPIKWINLMLEIMFSDSMHMISNVAQFFKWINFFILNKNANPYLLLLITETHMLLCSNLNRAMVKKKTHLFVASSHRAQRVKHHGCPWNWHVERESSLLVGYGPPHTGGLMMRRQIDMFLCQGLSSSKMVKLGEAMLWWLRLLPKKLLELHHFFFV